MEPTACTILFTYRPLLRAVAVYGNNNSPIAERVPQRAGSRASREPAAAGGRAPAPRRGVARDTARRRDTEQRKTTDRYD